MPWLLAVPGSRLPPRPCHGQDTGLPASGGWAGLQLSRGGEQCAVLLLEGKVLESPHGQGCAQALPGESRGEASREELGKAEVPAGSQASVGQGGTYPSSESLVSNYPLLLCEPHPISGLAAPKLFPIGLDGPHCQGSFSGLSYPGSLGSSSQP